MKTALFACLHDAGRSEIAAAFFNALADREQARAISAGTEPAERVHPEVVAAMREVGLDVSDARPQRLTAELAEQASLLVTRGCGDACPYVPGLPRRGLVTRGSERPASRSNASVRSATRSGRG